MKLMHKKTYLLLLILNFLPPAHTADFKQGDDVQYYVVPKPASARVSEALVSFFKASRQTFKPKIMPIHLNRAGIAHKLTIILSERCEDLEPFAYKFVEWSRTISKINESILPKCVCEDSVCAIELTDYFPDFFFY